MDLAAADGLLDAAPLAVVALDSAGIVIDCNRFVAELLGWSRADLVGADWVERFVPAAHQREARQMLEAARLGVPASGVHCPLTDRRGRLRLLAWWKRPHPRRDGSTGVLAMGHDLTEFRRVQEQMLQAERLAAIGEMMAGLAHESRNALQRSHACLEMLEARLADQPECVDLIRRLTAAQEHLQHLYESVRQYAAPIHLRRQREPLRPILAEAWDHLEQHRAGRGLSLAESVLCPEPTALVDRHQILQVYRNILENALAAAVQGPIAVTWEEARSDHGPAVQARFADDGPGLAPDVRERMFDPFFTTKRKGTGLGLAIVRRIVESHQGRVFAGHPERGAELVVALPMEP